MFRSLTVFSAILLAGAGPWSWLGPIPALAQETMQAAVVAQWGGPETLQVDQIARPVPGPGELLVRVRAAGVNPVDAAVRSGAARGMVGAELPYVPGFDVSGVVVETGAGVTRFEPGDEVFALLDLRRGGGYAQYALVLEDEAAPKPREASHAEAASLPLVALTAVQALLEIAELGEGQTVLVHGGAGGVGSVAVQLARWAGARVIATASERNHAFLRELGVEVLVDYNTQRFEEVARDVDVVLDPIGGETQERSLGVLREGGILVSLVGLTPAARSPGPDVRTASMLVRPDPEQLALVGRLVDEGHLRPVVTHLLPLDRAAEAHEQIETGHTRGKVVLELPASGDPAGPWRRP